MLDHLKQGEHPDQILEPCPEAGQPVRGYPGQAYLLASAGELETHPKSADYQPAILTFPNRPDVAGARSYP